MRVFAAIFQSFAALALTVSSSWAQATQEHRTDYLSVSPDVNPAQMVRVDVRSSQDVRFQNGIQMSPTRRRGTHLSVEASIVLKNADFDGLLRDSRAFDRYVQMGMPNLVDSRIVIPGAQEFVTWTHMATSVWGTTQSSQHFMQVRLTSGPNARGGQGQTWVLYSPSATERRVHSITSPEASAFWDFEGAWYMQPLSDGSIYCRYYIAGTMKNRLVGSIFGRGPAMSQFGSGVYQVMLRLATRAQERARRATRSLTE